MPLYEYECLECQVRTEKIQRFSDPLLAACPSCGGEVKRLIHAPAVQFKGTGWYVTDYGGKAESDKSGEAKESSSDAESRPKADKKEAKPAKEKSASTAKSEI